MTLIQLNVPSILAVCFKFLSIYFSINNIYHLIIFIICLTKWQKENQHACQFKVIKVDRANDYFKCPVDQVFLIFLYEYYNGFFFFFTFNQIIIKCCCFYFFFLCDLNKTKKKRNIVSCVVN